MNHPHSDIDIGVMKDTEGIENVLKTFWEKARAASELINHLRNEKKVLREQQEQMENEIRALRSDIMNKNQEIKRLQMEHNQLISSRSNVFTTQEKDDLKIKIKDLIAKINSYL